MAGFGGIGGLLDGVQQGYTFVKDAQRRSADDDFKKKEREREEKKWGREDGRQAQIEALNKEYFPQEAKTTPAPGLGMAAPRVGPDAASPGEQTDTTQADAVPAPAADAGARPAALATPSAAPVPAPAKGLGLTQALPQPGAAAQGGAPAGMPVQPNQMRSMNQSLDYLMRRAEIDMRTADGNGEALIHLHKLQQANRAEGLSTAIQLLQSGDNEGAMRAYNETGQSKGWQVQQSVDGVFKHGGTDIPTKLVTVKNTDGTVRTINTAQAMVQNQKIDQMIAQAQKGQEMDDRRADSAASRSIQQQNANTTENYRLDQADNMRAQRRLQEAAIHAKGNAASAPPQIWDEQADTFLKQRYTAADPTSGAVTVDGDGLQFGKAVALSRARSNGGDATSGLGYAFDVDNRLKQSAGQDPAKLRQLRGEYLKRINALAQGGGADNGTSLNAEWTARNAASAADAPARNDTRRDILMQELANEKDPENIKALQRDIARLGPGQPQRAILTPPRQSAGPAPGAPERASDEPAKEVDGMPGYVTKEWSAWKAKQKAPPAPQSNRPAIQFIASGLRPAGVPAR